MGENKPRQERGGANRLHSTYTTIEQKANGFVRAKKVTALMSKNRDDNPNVSVPSPMNVKKQGE